MIDESTIGKIKLIRLYKEPMNAFDLLFLQQLLTVLKRIEKEDAIHAVVITSGMDTIFSSGLDLRSISSHLTRFHRMELVKAIRLMYKIVQVILKSHLIYMVGMTGATIGSAVTFALASDLRFMTEKAWLWIPDPQYGGVLADGGMDLLRSICGASMTKKICLTNERINSNIAKQLGLVHEIMPAGDTEQYLLNYMGQLTSKYSMVTLQNTKRICNKKVLDRFHYISLLRVVYSNEMLDRLDKYGLRGKKR